MKLISGSQLFGIVAPCRVRHVYACNLVSVNLINDYDRETDDITLRLPIAGNVIMRPGDPPLPALHLYDADAADGHTSDAPGPCPAARRAAVRLLKGAATVAHIPLPDRCDWPAAFGPGTIHVGELLLLPRDPDGGGSMIRLSEALISAGHAYDYTTPRKTTSPLPGKQDAA